MAENKAAGSGTRPPWRWAFDRVERDLGPRLEAFARTEVFADALGIYASFNRWATRVVGGIANRLTHAMNLPTAPDLDKIHQHLSAIDSHISELIRETGRAGLDGSDPHP